MNNLCYKIGKSLKRSAPIILTCLGAVGFAATVITAIKATPKAMELIDEEIKLKNKVFPEITKLEPIEVFHTTWKCYIPTVIVGVSSLVCMFSAHALNKSQQNALAGAYMLIEQSYSKYRKSAKAVYGEDADKNIKAETAKDANISCSASGCQVYAKNMNDNDEKILFFDSFSNRYFLSTMAAVINAEYHVNRNMSLRGDVSLNEFYEFLGIDTVKGGNDVGWDIGWLAESCECYWIDFDNRFVQNDNDDHYVISTLIDPQLLDYVNFN